MWYKWVFNCVHGYYTTITKRNTVWHLELNTHRKGRKKCLKVLENIKQKEFRL